MQKYLRHLPFYPKKYLSHFFILISVVISLIGFLFPIFVHLFGLHRISLSVESLPFILGQLIFFQFLHGGWLHLFLNSYFLYQAGPEIEARMKRREYLLFFFSTTLFAALSLWIFSPYALTVGISGFCMALLSYLYMDLSKIHHPYANQILIMLVANVALGFTGNISFVGHASGAVAGFLWWYKKNKR
ncbi:rhomboid family intramembrane serine protease [Candidatus Gracilibacteria bacterium]|nr:rhomboid family intramembrane serine protease [Candidatus Gracilibacteria bacterium]